MLFNHLNLINVILNMFFYINNFDFDIDYIILFNLITLNIINNIKNYFIKLKLSFGEFFSTIKTNEGLRVCFISLFVATILTIYEIILFYAFVIPEINKEVNEGIKIIAYQIKYKSQLNIDVNNVNFIDFNNFNDNPFINLFNYLNLTIPYYDVKNNNIIFLNQYNVNYYEIYLNIINNFIISKTNILIQYILSNDIFKIFILSILKTLYIRESEYVNKINTYNIITVSFLLSFLIFSLLLIYNTLNRRKEKLGNYVWIASIFTITMILSFQYSFFIFANKYKYMGSTNTDEIIYYVLNQL